MSIRAVGRRTLIFLKLVIGWNLHCCSWVLSKRRPQMLKQRCSSRRPAVFASFPAFICGDFVTLRLHSVERSIKSLQKNRIDATALHFLLMETFHIVKAHAFFNAIFIYRSHVTQYRLLAWIVSSQSHKHRRRSMQELRSYLSFNK